MATLGGVFLDIVYSDEVDGSVKATEHPVEKGIDITDHVKANADIFSISGLITGTNAAGRRAQVVQLMKTGEVVQYLNRLALSNVIIVDFHSTHDSKVAGGLRFTATLKEVRFAQSTTIKENPTLTGILSTLGLQQAIGNTPIKLYSPKQGDTVQSVAKEQKVTPDKLYEKNRHVLSPGQVRLMPTSKIVIPLM